MTQEPLRNYLGLWEYRGVHGVKYYRVEPEKFGFRITWGATKPETLSNNPILIDGSRETHRRILSKARGGYKLIEPHTAFANAHPKVDDTFDSINELVELSNVEFRKRKPRKRKLSLLDWMSGKDEIRGDDEN